MMKYRIGHKTYYIGSTIIDKNITISDYSEAYHARWGHEELYKTLKIHLDGIEFHGKCESFIKQELFAALGILTLNRIMANYTEEILDENETFNNINIQKGDVMKRVQKSLIFNLTVLFMVSFYQLIMTGSDKIKDLITVKA